MRSVGAVRAFQASGLKTLANSNKQGRRSNELYTPPGIAAARGVVYYLLAAPMSSIAALRLVTARAAPAGRRAMGGGTATRPRPSTEGRAPAFNMCAGLLIFEALRWVDPLASRMGPDVGPSTLRDAVDATASQRTNARARPTPAPRAVRRQAVQQGQHGRVRHRDRRRRRRCHLLRRVLPEQEARLHQVKGGAS